MPDGVGETDPQAQIGPFLNDYLAPAGVPEVTPAAVQEISGAHPWIWILCKFSDYPGEPATPSYFAGLRDALIPYFEEVSYNKATIAGSGVVTHWYQLPNPLSYYQGSSTYQNLTRAAQDCTAVADADVDFRNYYGLNLMFNERLSTSFAGITTQISMTLDGEQRWWPSVFIGDNRTPPSGYFNKELNVHEMYHGFGLGHSAVRDQNWAVTDVNSWDPVGIGACMFSSCEPHHIPAPQKDELGWIDADKTYTATLVTQTITLEALALPQTNNYLMAKIPMESDHFYTLEARRKAGADTKVPGPAIIIHEVDWSPPCAPGDLTCPNGHIRLVPVPGLADPSGTGAMWTVGKVFTDTTYGITVTVVASTTTGFEVQIETRPAVNTILYVDHDAAGANNGTSWTDAFTDLQAALSAASPTGFDTVEIWVAEGTYKPTGDSSRTVSFGLKNNVFVYGGFAGTETDRSQRDVAAHPTILSGDLQGNDNANIDPAEATRADNSYHVVRDAGGTAFSVLDGFIITGGNANATSGEQSMGGGMFNTGTGAILQNITFRQNTAENNGGGLYNYYGKPTLDNVTFLGNKAYYGGGMYSTSSESFTLTDVAFLGNAAFNAGGLYASGTALTLVNAVFSGNAADYSGGGIINNVTLLTLINATFSANTAIRYTNSRGGGLSNSSGRTVAIANNIFWGNQATAYHYTDTAAQIYNEGTVSVTYSLVQGGVYTGTGNISSDPLFMDANGADNVTGTADDDLRLQNTSPAIDAGDNDAVPAGITTDLDGAPRFADHPQADTGHGTPPIVDMGAYEAAKPANHAPNTPTNPTPANGATNVGTITVLSWDGGDPDGDPVTYTVAFGTSSPPPVVDSVTVTDYNPGTLGYSLTYYWQITATDGLSTTGGPLWSFTTAPLPPGDFGKTSPISGATGVSTSLTLAWGASSGATSYEYCYDTSDNDTCDGSWASAGANTGAALSGLGNNTTYYWQVRAVNDGGTTEADGGTWWSFTTVVAPPGAFNKSGPANGMTGISTSPTLSWGASSGAATYEYCYDMTNNATCDGTWTSVGGSTSVGLSGLLTDTTYYWQTRAVNAGGTTYADSGTWWSFTTTSGVVVNHAPNTPTNPAPANGATNVVTTTTLTWSGGDPDGDPVTYTVAFGTSSPPPIVANVTMASYNPGVLAEGTLYYWRITATDGMSTTVGPLWSFTTVGGNYFIYLPLVLRNHSDRPQRLIVFEAFLSLSCGFCQTAAPIIDDQLVPEYAGRPVLFLEHNVDVNTPRRSRWWDGWAVGGTVGYPLVMTDSGNQVAERLTSGTDFYTVYKTMVDAALAVPEGQADIQATAVRTGDVVNFTINVTNRGSVTLGPSNSATVWVLVYEQSASGPVADGLTQRYVRAQVSQALSANLAPNGSAQYILTVDTLSGVDWSKMHAVVIVDYKPNPSMRPYNTYQAVAVNIP
ncbi:MAG: choice-of-anchor Q domain-containing protein [Anaerolineae bacterium]